MTSHVSIFRKTGLLLQSLSTLRSKVLYANIRPVVTSSSGESNLDDTLLKKSDPDMPIEDAVNPFEREKIKCLLCEHNIKVDYKNVRLLSQFVSRYTGKIYGQHITRLCKTQQERVEREIVKAQNAGLMGYYTRDLAYAHDPQLFNPEKPIRHHRF